MEGALSELRWQEQNVSVISLVIDYNLGWEWNPKGCLLHGKRLSLSSFHIFAVQWHTYDPNSNPPLTSVSLALLGSTAKFGPFYFTPCLSSTILVPVEAENSVLRSP